MMRADAGSGSITAQVNCPCPNQLKVVSIIGLAVIVATLPASVGFEHASHDEFYVWLEPAEAV
jgi:hypothetical protein